MVDGGMLLEVSPASLPVSAWRRLTPMNIGLITGNTINILRRATTRWPLFMSRSHT